MKRLVIIAVCCSICLFSTSGWAWTHFFCNKTPFEFKVDLYQIAGPVKTVVVAPYAPQVRADTGGYIVNKLAVTVSLTGRRFEMEPHYSNVEHRMVFYTTTSLKNAGHKLYSPVIGAVDIKGGYYYTEGLEIVCLLSPVIRDYTVSLGSIGVFPPPPKTPKTTGQMKKGRGVR